MKKNILAWSVVLMSFVLLYFVSLGNYLVFHLIVEIFTIIIAGAVFVIAINSQKYFKNHYLLFIGVSYLFIGIIDLFHTMTYTGMPIYTHLNYPANQLWIAARYYESIMLFIAFGFLYKRKINVKVVYLVNIILTSVVLLSILWLEVFPVCYIEGVGLTLFKKISEYIISAILVASLIFIYRRKSDFSKIEYRYLMFALICTIISELLFTFYISNYGISNLFGHYFKVLSFIFIYLLIVKEGLQDPFAVIFKELEEKRLELDKLASIDPLTGLANRRKMQEVYDITIRQAVRDKKWISLFILDIDDFKQFNDSFGHLYGDEILVLISRAIESIVYRPLDIVSRHGGEEFLVMLFDCSYEAAQQKAADMHQIINTMKYNNISNDKLTVSIGFVSCYCEEKVTLQNLIKEADKQLYTAKENNKNCSFGSVYDSINLDTD